MASSSSSRRRWPLRVLLVLAAMALGLVLGEQGFRRRDEDAFPHLRAYLPDPELGLRLEPNRSERIRFGGAPATTVHIGPDGLRGVLPPPSAARDEVLVVGDSQVFGLGVEDDRTFAAVLQKSLGRTVVDAGIPTYGPPEYEAMIEKWTTARPIGVVVLALTFQNDFFEAERPNRERHESWDGWAVRKGSAPSSVTHFPGREWLYRESHLFYALRRTLHEATDKAEEAAPGAAGVSSDARVAAVSDFATLGRESTEQLRAKRSEQTTLDLALAARQDAVLTPTPRELHGVELDDGSPVVKVREYETLLLARANPGDIVDENYYAEAPAISLRATAATIAAGAKLRERLEAEWHQKHAAEIEAARATGTQLRAKRAAFTFATNPLARRLQRIARHLAERGIGLVVVGIPMDVMLFDDAWQKYGVSQPPDISSIRGLAEELGAALAEAHVPWVFPESALRAGGSDVFMPREFHLTEKGHDVVATTLVPWIQRVSAAPKWSAPAPATSVFCIRCQDFEGQFRLDEQGRLHASGFMIEGRPDLPDVGYARDATLFDSAPGTSAKIVGGSELVRFEVIREPERWVVRGARMPRFREEGKWSWPPRTDPLGAFFDEAKLGSELRYPDRDCDAKYLSDAPTGGGTSQDYRDMVRWTKTVTSYLATHADALAKYRACQVGADDSTCAEGSIATGPAGVCRALCSESARCKDDEQCVAYQSTRVCARKGTEAAWTPPAPPPMPTELEIYDVIP